MLDNIAEKEILPVDDMDRAIPSQVAQIDTHIKFLKEQHEQLIRDIAIAESDRNALLARAKECHIVEDATYKIVEVPIYPKKRVDIEALHRLAPDRYDTIQQNIYIKLQDKLASETQRTMSFISQADVKAVIKDKVILMQIIPEPKEPSGYEISVVKK
jgi:hypothetical protein